MREMTDDYYIYDEDNMRLEGTSKHKIYKLGSKVKVKCISASKESKQIDFCVVSDKMNSSNKSTKNRGRRNSSRRRRYA